MIFFENKEHDEFGMTKIKLMQEFVALMLVFLMLFGCFLKVVFI